MNDTQNLQYPDRHLQRGLGSPGRKPSLIRGQLRVIGTQEIKSNPSK